MNLSGVFTPLILITGSAVFLFFTTKCCAATHTKLLRRSKRFSVGGFGSANSPSSFLTFFGYPASNVLAKLTGAAFHNTQKFIENAHKPTTTSTTTTTPATRRILQPISDFLFPTPNAIAAAPIPPKTTSPSTITTSAPPRKPVAIQRKQRPHRFKPLTPQYDFSDEPLRPNVYFNAYKQPIRPRPNKQQLSAMYSKNSYRPRQSYTQEQKQQKIPTLKGNNSKSQQPINQIPQRKEHHKVSMSSSYAAKPVPATQYSVPTTQIKQQFEHFSSSLPPRQDFYNLRNVANFFGYLSDFLYDYYYQKSPRTADKTY